MPSPTGRKSFGLLVLGVLFLAYLGVGIYHSSKPLPDGLNADMPVRADGEVRFLADYTWLDTDDQRQMEHEIFDRILALIEGAERLIVLDMFLFNDFAGASDSTDMRGLSAEVAAALISRKEQRPDMPIIVITDPINTLYGGIENDVLQRLEAAGVEVVLTRLTALRDSNPTWSGLWRLCCQWLGNSAGGGWLPSPLSEDQVSLRSLMALLNFKANHRKTLFTDTPDGWTGLVTSANPHDASSAHGNIAVEFTGQAALDLLATERTVARFSRPDLDWPEITSSRPGTEKAARADPPGTRIQVLTEAAIRDSVLELVNRAQPGESVDLAIFYLSQRDVVESLLAAHDRGVRVRVLIDPSQGAFGRDKDGVPNQPVAHELHQAGIPVRWCNTDDEQCHSKLILHRGNNGQAEFIAGSANYTRRNLDNLNLETSVSVSASLDAPAMEDAATYFDRRWHNHQGQVFSLPYDEHREDSRLRYWQYRFMEATGVSTF